jgi:ribosomal protein L11 methyltransferase
MNEKYYYSVIANLGSIGEEEIGEINLKSFDDFSCEGIEEYNLDEAAIDNILGREAYLGAEIPNELIQKLEGKAGQVKYHFIDEKNASEFKSFLKEKKINCELSKNSWEDWNKKWKQHYKPIVVSPELKIIPVLSEEEIGLEDDCIYIYPGMGFGTGTHETTYLSLKIATDLFKNGFRAANCLDFGCGSGILGIAVLKLTYANALFCDVDTQALDNCKKNLFLNFDDDRLHGSSLIVRDRLKTPEGFDLVFANILENILLAEKDLIIGSLKKGGKLIVSGLLKDQEVDFLEKFDPEKKLEKIRTEISGDWCAILFEAQT